MTAQFAVLEWEIVLGLWLLSGRKPVGAWLAAAGTFLLFAGVSCYLGVIGQASCGCFGSIQASPWHAFAVDVVALIGLSLGRPDFKTVFSKANRRTAVKQGFASALAVAALSVAVFGVATLAFGSMDAALARLRGEHISIQPDVLDVGHGQPNEVVEAKVEIVNRMAYPVRILGGTADCSCATTEDLPLTLAPGEARRVSIHVRLPGEPGFFNRKAILRTDCDARRTLLFGLSGRVDPPARAESGTTEE